MCICKRRSVPTARRGLGQRAGVSHERPLASIKEASGGGRKSLVATPNGRLASGDDSWWNDTSFGEKVKYGERAVSYGGVKTDTG